MKKILFSVLAIMLFSNLLVANSKTSGIAIQKTYEDYALSKVKSMAESGDSNAQYDLSERYHRGIGGVKKDQSQAIKWVKLAAKQNNSGAQNSLGYYYNRGLGVPQDSERALEYYKLAAKQEHRIAINNVGTFLMESEDYKKAAKFFRKALDLGYLGAKTNLGILYANGNGVSRNRKKAFRLYQEAALTGESNAQVNLAGQYYMGKGVAENFVMAMMWFDIATMNGHIYVPRGTSYRYLVQHMSSSDINKAKSLARQCYDSNYTQCDDKQTSNMGKTTAISKDTNTTNNSYDALANKKYNLLVEVVNKFSPKIRSSFNTYASACGADKDTRQKTMYVNMGGMKVAKPNSYNVYVHYEGSYKDSAFHALNESLLLQRFVYADESIKNYLTAAKKFTKLFTEAAEYYEMKDYTDDNFKKADAMHAPLVKAYIEFMQSDTSIRSIIEKISDMQVLKRIEAFKANDEMMFYFVEKAQLLSKKFLGYAHTDHFLKLDVKKIRTLHDDMRNHYKEFKAYKSNNESIFKDNGAYKSYLGDFKKYVSSSKDFYIRAKSKKAYPNGEETMMQYLPSQARASIEENITVSIHKLLKSYNALVSEYNGLNM
jgi:TPR repeat protein